VKIEYLEEFASLATTLNFTKAASKLYLSASVLSKHIASLEAELGIQLLARNATSVKLTPKGRHFYEDLLPILEQYKVLISGVKSDSKYSHKQLKIVIVARTNPLLKAALQVADSMRREEHINVDYSSPSHTDFGDSLKESDVDALITFVTSRAIEGAITVPLYRDPIVAVVAKDHPLAKNKTISMMRDLQDHQILKLVGPFFRPGYDTIDEWFAKYGVKPRTRFIATSSLDDLRLLSDFTDVFITPSEALQQTVNISEETHVILPFEEDVYFQVGIVYFPEKITDSLRLFIEKLKAWLDSNLP
jgi:LysR family cyn operon transcriptional activator